MWRLSTPIGLFRLWVAISVCLIAGRTAAATSGSFNATLTCSMVQNGTFLRDPTACDTWIQCVDEQPVYGKCSAGLFYDLGGGCVEPSTMRCYSSNPCATLLTDGFAADPYSCSGYYYCYNGTGTRGECSAGMNFNVGTKTCIRDLACSLVDPDSWCNIVSEFVFVSDPLDCRGYHMCLDGILENGTCPDGYYFDAVKGVCGYEADVKCNVPPLHPDLPGKGICATAGQFVADNATCGGYYYCQEMDKGDYLLIWGQCPSGRFFDPSNGGECVNRREIVCEHSRCDGLGATSIQLANASNDGCRGYMMCQDGQQIGSATCPNEEQYFDEVTQRCTSDVVNYTACATTGTSSTEVETSTVGN